MIIYPWLHAQWQQLLSQHQQQRLAHAILLDGPEGMGKLALAQNLAQLVLCEQATKQACGQCRSCILYTVSNHPDYCVVSPEEEAKSIKVEQIRDLIAQLSQHAHRGAYQVALIAPAEKMNRAAANALLKTLEEPSGKVLIILVANQSFSLPATILSRCQRINCNTVDIAEAKAWLQQQLGLQPESEAIDLLLQAASFAPLKALELANSDYLGLRQRILKQLVELQTNQLDLLKVALEWSKLNVILVLTTLQLIVFDLINLQLQEDSVASQVYPSALLELNNFKTTQQWFQFLDLLHQATDLCSATNNINAQLLLENLLVKYL